MTTMRTFHSKLLGRRQRNAWRGVSWRCLLVLGLLAPVPTHAWAQDFDNLEQPFGDAGEPAEAEPAPQPAAAPPGGLGTGVAIPENGAFGDDEPADGGEGAGPAEPVPQLNVRNDVERLSRPANQEVLNLYQEGLAKREQGAEIEAISSFNQALRSDPNFLPAHYELAQIYKNRKDYLNAQQHVAAVLQGMQSEFILDLYLLSAEISLGQKNYTEAAGLYEVASSSEYSNPELAYLYGQSRLFEALHSRTARAGGQFLTQAESALDRALTLKPDYPEALVARGRVQLQRARTEDPKAIDKGVADLEKALQIQPDNLAAAGKLGAALYLRGTNESRQHLGKTSRVIADLKKAHEMLVKFARGTQQTTTKEQRELEAKDLHPDDNTLLQTLVTLGAVDSLLANEVSGAEKSMYLEQSIAFCREALIEDPKAADAFMQMAISQRLGGQFAAAVESFTHAINFGYIQPDEAFTRRGISYYHLGSLEQAKSDFERAQDFKPGAVAAFWLGVIHAREGNHSEAIRQYSIAIQGTRFNYPLASLNRGISYLQMGDYERARQDFGETLIRDPQNARAKQLLESLRQRTRLSAR